MARWRKVAFQTIAESYVRMAAVWRYENIAALKYHQECERDMNQRIAMANTAEAAHLRAERGAVASLRTVEADRPGASRGGGHLAL